MEGEPQELWVGQGRPAEPGSGETEAEARLSRSSVCRARDTGRLARVVPARGRSPRPRAADSGQR